MDDRNLCSGFIRLYILHRASKGAIFGNGVLEELFQQGYRLSAGTLYPVLHALTAKGYLRVTADRAGSRWRKVYRTTPEGRRALTEAKTLASILFRGLFDEPTRSERRPRG
jgi:PadR family transcriptional regulator, regulatory protein PadR